jgi:hypothetical protein
MKVMKVTVQFTVVCEDFLATCMVAGHVKSLLDDLTGKGLTDSEDPPMEIGRILDVGIPTAELMMTSAEWHSQNDRY